MMISTASVMARSLLNISLVASHNRCLYFSRSSEFSGNDFRIASAVFKMIRSRNSWLDGEFLSPGQEKVISIYSKSSIDLMKWIKCSQHSLMLSMFDDLIPWTIEQCALCVRAQHFSAAVRLLVAFALAFTLL